MTLRNHCSFVGCENGGVVIVKKENSPYLFDIRTEVCVDGMIKCRGLASNIAVLGLRCRWTNVAAICSLCNNGGYREDTVLVSLLWGIFEIFCNNYNKKEDFHESNVKGWTFCSPLDGKWSDGRGLRAQNMFAKEQISSLECTVTEVFRDSVWESLASFWILTLRYPRRQRLVPGELIFWRWALAPSKGRRTGFLSKGETWPKSGLCLGQMASVQASCATHDVHLAERYSTAPAVLLIKQWKSMKDAASSAGQSSWVPGKASSGLAAGQEEGGLPALPSPHLKSTANAQQPSYQPDAN